MERLEKGYALSYERPRACAPRRNAAATRRSERGRCNAPPAARPRPPRCGVPRRPRTLRATRPACWPRRPARASPGTQTRASTWRRHNSSSTAGSGGGRVTKLPLRRNAPSVTSTCRWGCKCATEPKVWTSRRHPRSRSRGGFGPGCARPEIRRMTRVLRRRSCGRSGISIPCRPLDPTLGAVGAHPLERGPDPLLGPGASSTPAPGRESPRTSARDSAP
jgi:hypothetical protein